MEKKQTEIRKVYPGLKCFQEGVRQIPIESIPGIRKYTSNLTRTVEPQFNEPVYNEVFGITNDILHPGLLKWMEKNLDTTNQFPKSLTVPQTDPSIKRSN